MNPEFLLAHFDRISAAPDAIPKLRGFILDLAVRGKLVEQNPTDEPAAELMNKIAATKSKLAKSAGVLRTNENGAESVPFKIPSNWVWVRLGDICSKTGSGSTPRGGKSVYQRKGVPFLRSQNVHDGGLRLDDVAYISPQTHEKMSGTAVEPGDLLLNITGGSIGRCCSVPASFGQANVSQHVAIIRVAIGDLRGYLHQLIVSPYFQSFVFSEQTGAGRGGLPKNRMDRIPVALPPLPEQLRIVSRVNDLMALCDQLEAAKTVRETQRDRLAAAAHHHLDNGTTAEEFRHHANFYLSHIPHITTRPDQIKQLRQTILNLAFRGRLVPQTSDDEPASELFKRIQAKKALVAKGRIKPPAYPTMISGESVPFHLPASWLWVHFGELVEDADAGWSPKSEDFPRSGDNWGVLKVSAVSWDRFLPEENKQLFSGVVPPISAQVHAGNFLISRANTSELVAKSVVVEEEPRNLILSDKIVRVQTSEDCDKTFLSMVNNHAPYARAYYAEEASGTSFSMKNVSRAVIYGLAIPLPPLAEQRRIMAKVKELMALCDQLEEEVDTIQEETRRLLESVLHHALKETEEEIVPPEVATVVAAVSSLR